MTLAYRTDSPIYDAVSVTTAASVAVHRAIRAHAGICADIKWVNDLYYGGKKVCGILTEALPCPPETGGYYIIVGIGINLHTDEFPPELSSVAGSLGVQCDTCRLIGSVVELLMRHAQNPTDRSYMEDYRRYSMVLGKEVVCTQAENSFSATVREITDSGALCVVLQDGSERLLQSGEITLRLLS